MSICMNSLGGVSRTPVPDNCKTAVVHNGGWKDQQINETYQEMAEHYGTAIIPARVRTPKDKPNAEGTVGNISTWTTAALRDEQFFSLAELNRTIRDKLELFNQRLFQKKEGSWLDFFLEDEKPLLSPLPATRFELMPSMTDSCERYMAWIKHCVSKLTH